MKTKLKTLLLSLMLATTTTYAAPAKTDAEYEKAIQSMMADYSTINSSFLQVIPQIMQGQAINMAKNLQKQMPNEDPAKLQAFAKMTFQVSTEKLMPEMKKLVETETQPMVEEMIRQSYTRQEIMDLYKFNQSPSGKSIKAKMPQVTKDMTVKIIPMQQKLGASIDALMQKNIDNIMTETIARLHQQGIDFTPGETSSKAPAPTPAALPPAAATNPPPSPKGAAATPAGK